MFKTLFKNLCPIKVLTSSGGHTLLSNEVTDSRARQPGRLLTSSVQGCTQLLGETQVES